MYLRNGRQDTAKVKVMEQFVAMPVPQIIEDTLVAMPVP